MADVGTYVFLPGTTEEAFEFYKAAFGTEFAGNGLMRYSNAPENAGVPDDQAHLVMHVGLPTLGDHMLMGTDSLDVNTGNSVQIMLMPDTKGEADALFAKLGDGGSDLQPMDDMVLGRLLGRVHRQVRRRLADRRRRHPSRLTPIRSTGAAR